MAISRPSVLFVCTANLIRSPMAAALFRVRLMMNEPDWRTWRVDSAGTWAAVGRPAAIEAQTVMQRRGLDISNHRSRPVTYDLLRRFRLTLTMEQGHKESILAEFPEYSGQVFLLSEMAGLFEPLPDPVGGTLIEFERTADTIDRWLTAGMARIHEMAAQSVA